VAWSDGQARPDATVFEATRGARGTLLAAQPHVLDRPGRSRVRRGRASTPLPGGPLDVSPRSPR
jgi:hypothetical protein